MGFQGEEGRPINPKLEVSTTTKLRLEDLGEDIANTMAISHFCPFYN